MSGIIHNKFGRSWPTGLVFVSYPVFVLSIFVTIANPIVGPILFVLSAFFGFTSSGILLDPENKRYKDYTDFFGFIRQGKWQSLEGFPYMGILRRNLSSTIQSPGNVASITNTETVFDICLLSQNHWKKLLVKRMKDYEKTKPAAAALAQKLGVELTNYNPVISEATRSRRR